MSRRVLLVAPPHHHTPGPFQRWAGVIEPPLGLAHLASASRRADATLGLEILDAPARGWSVERVVTEIIARRPDVLGLSVATPTAPVARTIARRIKERLPDCLVAAGGSHPSALPEDLLPDVDVAVIGEGERTFVEILKGTDRSQIRGIAYCKGSTTVQTGRPEPIPNLDSLPFPAYDLLPLDRYRYPYPIRAKRGRYVTSVTSRGCPGRCAFCAKSAVWGSGVRSQSARRIVDDLEQLVRRFQATLLYFYDDTFLASRPRALELCGLIRDAGLPLAWIAQGRVEEVDEDTCRALASAGCVQIEIGVECGDENVLESAGKPFRFEDAERAISAARRAGLETKANFLFGFPAETRETVAHTIRAAVRLDPTYANFFHLIPFPGSRYHALYESNGWLTTREWGHFVYHDRAIVSVPGAPSAALDAAMRSALLHFYLRIGKIVSLLRTFIRARQPGVVLRGSLAFLNELFRR